KNDYWNQTDNSCSHQAAPVGAIFTNERIHAKLYRFLSRRRNKQIGKHEFIPRLNEGKKAGSQNTGTGHWENNAAKRLQPVGSINKGSFFNIPWNPGKKCAQIPNAKGQRK